MAHKDSSAFNYPVGVVMHDVKKDGHAMVCLSGPIVQKDDSQVELLLISPGAKKAREHTSCLCRRCNIYSIKVAWFDVPGFVYCTRCNRVYRAEWEVREKPAKEYQWQTPEMQQWQKKQDDKLKKDKLEWLTWKPSPRKVDGHFIGSECKDWKVSRWVCRGCKYLDRCKPKK